MKMKNDLRRVNFKFNPGFNEQVQLFLEKLKKRNDFCENLNLCTLAYMFDNGSFIHRDVFPKDMFTAIITNKEFLNEILKNDITLTSNLEIKGNEWKASQSVFH